MGSTRYSPPWPTPVYPPRVHPCPTEHARTRYTEVSGSGTESNLAVGLISVGQLSLDTHISGFGTMTEVYNLVRIGRINNH